MKLRALIRMLLDIYADLQLDYRRAKYDVGELRRENADLRGRVTELKSQLLQAEANVYYNNELEKKNVSLRNEMEAAASRQSFLQQEIDRLSLRIKELEAQKVGDLEAKLAPSPHWVLCEERYPDGAHESYWCQYHDGTRSHHNYTPGREKYTDSVWHPDFKLRNEEGLQSVKAWLEEPDRKGRSNA